ncbi:Helix-turn-helix [Mycolicibacterium neoaurum]|uniref:helix-turn-helix domain-containing protein n=1 Tax=Mycolicibacterium neoaurum TaxID=1795 RepID=UPI00068BEF59|nr:helix-turn-helix transcriptional regulator [Mycolicibacterium neoaurum]SDD59706.1 Helix-turn-helix [Mycolicibacterium neoaurum]
MTADFRAVVDELRALRLTRNLPQRTIARRMGICRSAITRLENDPTRDPHLSTILRYAHAIGATITITPKNLEAHE